MRIDVHAPGADSISIQIGSGYPGRVVDPLATAQRGFVWWAFLAVLTVAAGVVVSVLFMIFLPVCVLMAACWSYEAWRWRHGYSGLGAFGTWLMTPDEWWPIWSDNAPELPQARPRKAPSLPLSYRAGLAWYRVRQMPRRAWYRAFRRPVPASVGTLRLTYEPVVQLDIWKNP